MYNFVLQFCTPGILGPSGPGPGPSGPGPGPSGPGPSLVLFLQGPTRKRFGNRTGRYKRLI